MIKLGVAKIKETRFVWFNILAPKEIIPVENANPQRIANKIAFVLFVYFSGR